ncbi:MAG: TetR/AcrR family transcriptional regulator [Sphingomonadales bacterium]|nr:MAG: TetR/AcrR family transcriptional regulator [Sphingomonadales bacterium]TNF03735.1 MAG: TetR/AcrR family transcriptional regulator [Sphingomonadales bacterium]
MLDGDEKSRNARGAALLQPDRTRAIWRAAIIELARVGYGRLSMEVVAKRAGVGKAALYRRWPGKEAMVIALIRAIGLEVIAVSDQGSLEADVRRYIADATRILSRPLSVRILPDLYSEMGRDTPLAEAIRATVQERKRKSAAEIVDRAVRRGELDGAIQREMAFDFLAGPIYWRMLVTRRSIDEHYGNELTSAIIGALSAMSRQRHVISA